MSTSPTTTNTAASARLHSSEYIGWQLDIFTAFFLPILIIAVALRFYTRWLVRVKFGYDDILVILALVHQVIQAALGLAAVHAGYLGHHILFLEANDPAGLVIWSKYLTAISNLYFFGVNLPKLAILALFLRLFPGRRTKLIIYLLAGILVGSSVSVTIAGLAACQPFAANWDATLPGGHCIDKETLFICASIPSIVTDVVMLVLPMPLVWGLKMNATQKVALSFTFLVGSLGLITSILRFATFFDTNSFKDSSFVGVKLDIWTQTEPGVYLISACLPTYRPLLQRLNCMGRPARKATSSSTANNGNAGGDKGYRFALSGKGGTLAGTSGGSESRTSLFIRRNLDSAAGYYPGGPSVRGYVRTVVGDDESARGLELADRSDASTSTAAGPHDLDSSREASISNGGGGGKDSKHVAAASVRGIDAITALPLTAKEGYGPPVGGITVKTDIKIKSTRAPRSD